MIDWSINFTSLIAIYGAILSSLLLVKEFYELGRKVKIRLNFFHILPAAFKTEVDFNLWFNLELHCVNKRKRPIQINKVGIKTNLGTEIYFTDPAAFSKPISGGEPYSGAPFCLSDGEGKIISIDVKNLLSGFMKSLLIKDIESKKIQGWVIDASEKKYYSKKIDFNIKELIEYFPDLATEN